MGESTGVPLRRNRDYQLLLTGGTISSVGTMMSELALPLLTYAVTGNATIVGIVGAAELLGLVGFGLFAGALSDRWHRGRTLRWSSYCAAIPYLTIALAYWYGVVSPALLVVAALLVGALSSFYDPIESAAMNLVVPDEQLPAAMSTMQVRQSIADLLGPPLAGLFFGIGRVIPIVIDAASFVAAGVCARLVRTPLPAPAHPGDPEPVVGAVRQGLRFLFADPVLRMVVLAMPLGNAALNGVILVSTIGMQQRHESGLVIGLVSACLGIGGLAGAAVAPRLLRRLRVGALALAALWVLQAAITVLAWQRNVWGIGLAFFAMTAVLPIENAGFSTYRMMRTPDRLQGRVRSANIVLVMGLSPIGIALGGWALQTLGLTSACLLMAAVNVLSLIPVTVLRPIRSLGLAADFVRVTETADA